MAWSTLRKTFSNRNIFVLSFTNALATFFNTIYQPYWADYLHLALGIPVLQIGVLQALTRTNNLLFAFPGGLLADRIGRKPVAVMGAIARMGTSIFYMFARSYEWLLIGTIINAMQSISTAAFTAAVAESVPRNQRGTGYGVFELQRRIPGVFTGVTGGFLMDTYGIYGGTQACFVGGLICGIVIFLARFFLLTETLSAHARATAARRTIRSDFREVIPLFQGSLKYMQVTSAIYQFAAGLTSQLLILWVHDYIGLTYTEWGTILTIMSVVGLVMAVPGGMMADKYNRVKLNVWARALYPITTSAYIFQRDFLSILGTRLIAGVGMGLSGAAEQGISGGTSWNALMADLVPAERRGRFQGIMSTFNGIVSLPAPYIGAYLWEIPAVGPIGDFWIQLFLGLASTIIFGMKVKDPRFDKSAKAQVGKEEEEEEEEKDDKGTPTK
jgi:MFS family permease